MSLKIYNTLTKKVDEFKSIKEGLVSIYSCGPTVYDHLHLGNWSAYIYWDVLTRLLLKMDYEINRVINITDVGHLTSDADEGEDKIEKGARREGKNAWKIAEFYTNEFLKDFEKLGLIKPTYFAKATDYINEQFDLIRRLKNKGFTYQISDGIYFDTSKFSRYAEFANLDLESLKAGARVNYNPEKKQPSDFALWKFTRFGQKRDMEWETPIDLLEIESEIDDKKTGTDLSIPSSRTPIMGFPGWHLECSAIAMNLLGETIDIHTGGIDHIPVHHTNEIAQSESATGKRFCNYWLHNNHLKIDGSKISKSLGNGYTLDDIEKKGFSLEDFKMFVLQGRYDNEGNFTFESLESARNRLKNWRSIAVLRHQTHDTLKSDLEILKNNKLIPSYAAPQALVEALSDNLNTPKTLAIIDEVFSEISEADLEKINQKSLTQFLKTIDDLLGIKLIESTTDIDDETKKIILERKQARDKKDFKLSDKLRHKLEKMGIILKDTEQDTIWQYK
ncbi:MAG: cysteine--tRNA ligase [Candidatus Saccharimonadales bacterium]